MQPLQSIQLNGCSLVLSFPRDFLEYLDWDIKMRLLFVFAAALQVLPVFGTLSLTFSDLDGTFSGLSDSSGDPSGVLTWGVLIDTGGDGLPVLGGSVGLNLQDGVDLGSSDLFFLGGSTLAIPPGGGVGTASGIDPYAYGGVSANDPFYILWWGDTNIVEGSELLPGTDYGLFTDSSFLLPADGADISYSAQIEDNTIRPANLSLVPEPSTLILLLGSLIPLIRRRR